MKIKRESPVYQMFLKLFFLPNEQYPREIQVDTPGRAVSLAQKLNQCRKQHMGEGAMADAACPWSAKAHGMKVVISERAPRQRTASWILELNSGLEEQKPVELPDGKKLVDGPLGDDMFEKWLKDSNGKNN